MLYKIKYRASAKFKNIWLFVLLYMKIKANVNVI